MATMLTEIHGGSGTRVLESVTVSGGITLEYAAQGPTTGTPVIFLHGVTDSWRSFEGVLAKLPASMRAFAISQRGHGNSSRPAAGYLYQDMANDLRAFMDALHLPPAVVVGHSMGAMVARQFALSHSSHLTGLVLMGGFWSIRRNPLVEEFVDSAISQLADPIDPAFVKDFQLSTIAREVPSELVDTAVIESLKVPARVWRAAFEGFLTNDCSGDFRRMVAPTLIAWGDQDSYAGRFDQDALLAAIPGSRLVVYEGAGHAFHWEDPATFAADLVAFVSGLGSPSR
jgi:pimeloyl-ACP methyl ester carboxylesterase